VHHRLLDEATTARLLERARIVYGWPVDDPGTARRLLAWGAIGLISDDVALLADLGTPGPRGRAVGPWSRRDASRTVGS
jgi:hypothetical protein